MGFASMFGAFTQDLAIDLGTANTLIYQRGSGVVCNEPSVVAVQQASAHGKRKVLAIGSEAKNMLGRTPESISAVRPLKDGVISDFEITEEMLRRLIRRVSRSSYFFRPRVVISVPRGVTEVEKRAVRESAELAGARQVFLIEEPMAAAIGAGLPTGDACGNMVIDIGGGTAEVAVISLNGIVYSKSLRVGGGKMDQAISLYLRRRHGLLVGERMAEQVKLGIGSALPTGRNLSMQVKGRDLVQGIPKAVVVGEDEIREALSEPIGQIVEMVKTALEKTPPELASDIVDKGITLTGGGALLRRLDKLIARETDLPVLLVDDPLAAVVMGSGAVWEREQLMREVTIQ
jgi:rod shape-determining protein MreB